MLLSWSKFLVTNVSGLHFQVSGHKCEWTTHCVRQAGVGGWSWNAVRKKYCWAGWSWSGVREKHCYLAGGWRLVLERCEREILYGWRLVHQPNTVTLSTRPFCAFSLINLYNHLGFRIKQWVLFFKEMDHFSVKYFLVKTFESYGCPCLF